MSSVIEQFEWVSSAKFCLIGTFDCLFEERLAKGENGTSYKYWESSE